MQFKACAPISFVSIFFIIHSSSRMISLIPGAYSITVLSSLVILIFMYYNNVGIYIIDVLDAFLGLQAESLKSGVMQERIDTCNGSIHIDDLLIDGDGI